MKKQMIKKRNIVIIFVFTLSMFSINSLYAQNYPEKGDFAKGAQTWSETCARCHNMRDPKDLRDDQWVTTLFHMRVRAGLTGQQTRDILTFLQESNNNVTKVNVSGSATRKNETPSGLTGEQIYQQTCIACHGSNGSGTVPGAPDFNSKMSPLNKDDETLIKNIIEGYKSENSPMAMPPKGGNMKLSYKDIIAVVDYMRNTFNK
jgi:cytochrome c5